jgi:Domain of unknown function (DUF4783)
MKKLLFTVFIFLTICSRITFAQSDILEDISVAFNNSDQRLLSKYFNNKVEITLLDQSNVFSKSQAEMVMKDFFSKYTSTEFKILYKNNPSNDAARFAIGQLDTQNGRFRIYFIFKTIDNTVYLQEMRFEQEKQR